MVEPKSHTGALQKEFGGDKAVEKTRDTDRALMMRMRHKRAPTDFMAWATLLRGGIVQVRDEKGERERLIMLFSYGVVTIEGHYLDKLLDEYETERTKIVTEMNSSKVTEKMIANRTAVGTAVEPIIISIKTEPGIEEMAALMLKSLRREDGPFDHEPPPMPTK